MAESSIPVDLLNPGQVFACLGFLEAADVLLGNAEGGFDWNDETDIRFQLRADGETEPVKHVIQFINSATAVAISPAKDVLERDKGDTQFELERFPAKFHDRQGKLRNALLPIELRSGSDALRIDYWADLDSGRPILRLWTATNGNSAWVRFRKLREALSEALSQSDSSPADPFQVEAVVGANFRLELRRNWISLDLGFSPDKINKNSACIRIEVLTFPVVELLAAAGLSHARPMQVSGNWLEWKYSAWSGHLPPELARVAIAQPVFRSSARRFRMQLEQPNDGGDLSISDAYEE